MKELAARVSIELTDARMTGVQARSTTATATTPTIVIGLILAALAGCTERGSEREITHTGTASAEERPAHPGATSAERFGSQMGPASGMSGDAGAADSAATGLRWDVPAGWVELAATQSRIANLRVGEAPGAECYVTVLQGSGGGLAANVDRWRSQMGLGPYSTQELAGLPKRLLLEQEAVLVEIDGTYTGMGSTPQADFRMYGLILSLPVGTIFVKMTGPRALLLNERERFLAFCDSLRLSETGEGAPAGGSSDPGAGAAPEASLTWTAPQSWRADPPRPMREVSFRLGPEAKTECYVSLLGGNAGGLVANLNRWRGQLGLEAILPAELDALERIDVLGQKVPLLEAYGSYKGMDGQAIERAGLLAVDCELAESAVFVKMIGPEDDVRAAKADFVAFCASLEGM